MQEVHVNPPVVVGVDGSDHGLRALDWAAATALPRRWAIQLVHASQPDAVFFGMGGPVSTVDLGLAAGESMLAAAKSHLRSNYRARAAAGAEVDVTSVILRGPEIPALLGALGGGRMLVLGRRGVGRFAELVVGSTTTACAAKSRGPVVVVPPTWRAGQPRLGVVVLGVDGTRLGEDAIGFAFDEASWRGARLEVVHSWQVPVPYGYDAEGWDGVADWRAEAELAVAEAIAGWRDKFPDVEVNVTMALGHPVGALVEHSATADLLVVGGRHHSELLGRFTGSTELAVLHHAVCPVAVVHTPAAN